MCLTLVSKLDCNAVFAHVDTGDYDFEYVNTGLIAGVKRMTVYVDGESNIEIYPEVFSNHRYNIVNVGGTVCVTPRLRNKQEVMCRTFINYVNADDHDAKAPYNPAVIGNVDVMGLGMHVFIECTRGNGPICSGLERAQGAGHMCDVPVMFDPCTIQMIGMTEGTFSGEVAFLTAIVTMFRIPNPNMLLSNLSPEDRKHPWNTGNMSRDEWIDTFVEKYERFYEMMLSAGEKQDEEPAKSAARWSPFDKLPSPSLFKIYPDGG